MAELDVPITFIYGKCHWGVQNPSISCADHCICPAIAQLAPFPASPPAGEHDWMDAKAARRLVEALAKHRPAAFPGDLKVMVTPDAG